MCCCGGGGCKPEPKPEPPCPDPDPEPCPPKPDPCPDPGCLDGVLCNGIVYQTIAEALEDNPCAGEIIVGCGTYELPPVLASDLCLKGQGVISMQRTLISHTVTRDR